MSQTIVHTQTKLTKEQKEAVGLLSIGTFLEYFDLMLYVHMAVLLNELFFPKTDLYIKSLITAAAFCSTYIMRPFGAIIFGWIGDNIGRKYTLILTTLLMSGCCLTMANLPTYAEIGITASIVLTICRIIQGMSSMGEMIGAQIYLTEFINVPVRYQAVAGLVLAATAGAFAALGLASLVLSNPNFSWRYAFGVGAFIALVGWVARSSLRETSEFVNAKRQANNSSTMLNDRHRIKSSISSDNYFSYKTVVALFALDCMWPLCFYFTYIYCGSILQEMFHYTSTEVTKNNFIVSIFQVMMNLIFLMLCRILHPLKIVQIKAIIVAGLFAIFPFYVGNASSGVYILVFQCILIFFTPAADPAVSAIYSHFPVLKRFTYSSFLYALSRAIVYITTSFGFILLYKSFGHYGISVFALFLIFVYLWGRKHFVILEKQNGTLYPFVNNQLQKKYNDYIK